MLTRMTGVGKALQVSGQFQTSTNGIYFPLYEGTLCDGAKVDLLKNYI